MDGPGGPGGAKRVAGGGGGGAGGGGGQCVLKFLITEALAPAVIGKGGAVIAAMRASCSAKITLTEQGDVYPQTDCRVLTAQAPTEENLNELCRQLVAKLAELQRSGGSGSDALVQGDDEVKIKTLVPRAAVGGIIGKGGNAIRQIREQSGAKVSISEAFGSGPGAEQMVSIDGTVQAQEYVLSEVNKQIQMLISEGWYATWASTNSTVQSGSGRGGGTMGGRGGGGAGALGGFHNQNLDMMMRVATQLPPYVMEDSRGFALSCVVPNRLVGGLIGRGGAGTKEVQMMTGTRIGIREIPGDPDNRSLNIAGPLASTCTAYMLMMKRYLDSEAQASAGAPSR